MLWESKKTGGDIQDVYKQEFHISFGFFACGKGRVGGEGFVTLLCRMGYCAGWVHFYWDK